MFAVFAVSAVSSLALVACLPAPQTITVVAERSTAVADGSDAVTITATGIAADGSPFQGSVDFTATAGGQLSDAHVTSDRFGVSKTKLTAKVAGPITVTATVPAAANQPKVSGSTIVTFAAGGGPRLRFQASPMDTVAQNLLRPMPVVVIEDSAGVVKSSSALVTVAVTSGSCSASLDPTSLAAVSAEQGVATFYGLKISLPATGCTLTATSGSLQPALSNSFSIR